VALPLMVRPAKVGEEVVPMFWTVPMVRMLGELVATVVWLATPTTEMVELERPLIWVMAEVRQEPETPETLPLVSTCRHWVEPTIEVIESLVVEVLFKVDCPETVKAEEVTRVVAAIIAPVALLKVRLLVMERLPPMLALVVTPKFEAVALAKVEEVWTTKVEVVTLLETVRPPREALLVMVKAVPAPLRTKVEAVAAPEMLRVFPEIWPVVVMAPEPAFKEPTVVAPETVKAVREALPKAVWPETVRAEIEVLPKVD